ncbi:hypothetical protein KZW03_30065, partial [Klebsiella pneumoniae]|nr:hypothetical protein [Klebsiella pneumoniae]
TTTQATPALRHNVRLEGAPCALTWCEVQVDPVVVVIMPNLTSLSEKFPGDSLSNPCITFNVRW